LLELIRTFFSIITIALAGHGLITQNFELMSYMMLFLGASMLSSGLIELKKYQKRFLGCIFIAISLFAFFVSIQGFFF